MDSVSSHIFVALFKIKVFPSMIKPKYESLHNDIAILRKR